MIDGERVAKTETRIDGLEKTIDQHSARLDKHEDAIAETRRTMAWMLGIGAILAALASQAKDILGAWLK